MADNYGKERCFRLAADCHALAALMALQARAPDVQMLGLREQQVMRVMTHRGAFADSLVLARAYNVNSLSFWVAPIYQQAVVRGNLAYMHAYLAHFPPGAELWLQLQQHHRAHPAAAQHAAAFQALLDTFLDDVFLKYDMACECGFAQLARRLAATPEVQYFKEGRTQAVAEE